MSPLVHCLFRIQADFILYIGLSVQSHTDSHKTYEPTACKCSYFPIEIRASSSAALLFKFTAQSRRHLAKKDSSVIWLDLRFPGKKGTIVPILSAPTENLLISSPELNHCSINNGINSSNNCEKKRPDDQSLFRDCRLMRKILKHVLPNMNEERQFNGIDRIWLNSD